LAESATHMATARLDRALRFRLATSERCERTVRSLPGGEALAWRAAARYVAGSTEEDALRRARELDERGIGASLDLFGQHVRDLELARSAAARYEALARRLCSLSERVWLSIDLSHIGLDVDPAACRALLERIAGELPDGRLIQVAAKDAGRADRVLDIVPALAASGAPLCATLPANLRRSESDAEALGEAGVHVRLGKGAFLESPEVAWPYGEETDVAFVDLAHRLAANGTRFALATHDRTLRESLLRALPQAECELLLGVRGEDAERLASQGRIVRVYIPFGDDWFRYWMRRLAESRGA
jgi:proline dehydrogenase